MFIYEHKKHKGLTLTELLASLAIISIVCIAIYSLFSYEENVFQSSNKQFNIQSNARIAIDYVVKETRYSTDLDITTVDNCKNEISAQTLTNGKHYNYIYIENGSLKEAVYDASHSTYNIKNMLSNILNDGTFFKKGNSGSILNINITAESGSKKYNVSSNIELKNFALVTPVQTIDGGEDRAIKYTVALP